MFDSDQFLDFLSISSPPTVLVLSAHRRRERQQRLNDVEDADVKTSSPSVGAALGGGTISPARQYVKDLSDPMCTRIGIAKLNRQQQQTVPRRQEHRPTDGWQNVAFATSDPSWEKHQTTRF
jgi:hypothetical protein